VRKTRGTSGRSSSTPFASWDHESLSWRTCADTSSEDSTASSVTLPTQGSMRNGRLYAQVMPVPAIGESGCLLLPTPTARDWKDGRPCPNVPIKGLLGRTVWLLRAGWGDYQPAVKRWEHIFGRPSPLPTDNEGRLAVPFVEWMMGFPEGGMDGLTRTAALRCLGNAVVPHQGVMALSMLTRARVLSLARERVRSRAA
jgi:hypothetical protein